MYNNKLRSNRLLVISWQKISNLKSSYLLEVYKLISVLSFVFKHCAKSKMNQNQRFCLYKTSKNEVYRERKALDENCKGSM